MIKMILISIISFVIGFWVRGIKPHKKTKKLKPLSKMTKKEYREKMKELEIR